MERTIKVTGKGSISIKPDLTVIYLDFSRSEKEYYDAVKRSTEDVNTIKKVLADLGFKKDELKTTDFNILYDYKSVHDAFGGYHQEFIGFKYSQTLKFSFDISNKKLGEVLYALSKLDVKPRVEIEYTVKNSEESKNILLKGAVKDAQRKAEIIAEASNVKLGSILNIDYSFKNVDFRTHVFSSNSDMCDCCGAPPSFDIDIDPDDIKASDTVTVIYEIS